MEGKWILSFQSKEATLATSGGKGANLARLAQARFPVPPGFLVTTDAYRYFLEENDLLSRIAEILAATALDQPNSLHDAAQEIRSAFSEGKVPAEVERVLRKEYRRFLEEQKAAHETTESTPVAVRSSATAEDLPELSFAGQQDTYLNVIGEEALLSAVVSCWSSLWTARAIGYRARNEIPQEGIALAVVVQQMIPSEVSGVLFTANPLNGKRTEMVIDATWGLGEALVAGMVEPDHYVVEAATGRILERRLGSKSTIVAPRTGGGTDTIEGEADGRATLSQEAVEALVELGQRVADHYGSPQDIEWGWAQDRLYLLQSRPITSLYPLVERIAPPPADSLQLFLSFGAVQGMLDPMTPLGRDFMRGGSAGAAGIFGYELSPQTQRVLYEAGGRLFINVTSVIRHPLGRAVLKRALPMVEPGAAQSMNTLLQDPRLAPSPNWFRFRTVKRLLRGFSPVVVRFVSTLRRPQPASKKVQAYSERLLRDYARRSERAHSLSSRLALLEHLTSNFAREIVLSLLPVIAAGMASLNLLNRLATSAPGEHNALELTRGLPNNVTTEMDLALWASAQRIRASEAAVERFARDDASELTADYLAGRLPPAAQGALETFLQRYGMRGVGEIDLGRPRWAEEPTPVIRTLQSFLQIEDPQMAPDAIFRKGAARAHKARRELAGALRHTRGGELRVRLMQMAADRVRALGGLRESPKFLVVRLMGLVRKELLKSGEQLVGEGILARPGDLFFLHLDELKDLANGTDRNWKEVVAERRAHHAREKRRRQIPRLMLSDGQAFYEGMASEGDGRDGSLLTGSPVSPGTVEGIARIIFDPHGTQLAPGEILVCPGTDPAWTPLFLAAGGLVMEVGGLMTHGSVVAREYGIPAVVGVHRATERLQTGQRVKVDGTAGRVQILDPPASLQN